MWASWPTICVLTIKNLSILIPFTRPEMSPRRSAEMLPGPLIHSITLCSFTGTWSAPYFAMVIQVLVQMFFKCYWESMSPSPSQAVWSKLQPPSAFKKNLPLIVLFLIILTLNLCLLPWELLLITFFFLILSILFWNILELSLRDSADAHHSSATEVWFQSVFGINFED